MRSPGAMMRWIRRRLFRVGATGGLPASAERQHKHGQASCPWHPARILLICAWCTASATATPFAVEVVDYSPAPGQFVNNAQFNDPAVALGSPQGAGIIDGDESSVVTLGGFGGSITLRFDHTVEDDPRNPFGMDAIVFGNAFWIGGDPDRHWAECATIEIALDADGDGEPDGATWYVIPGSHIADVQTAFAVQTWDDDTSDPTYPPALASWIPAGSPEMWDTGAYLLPTDLFGTPIVDNPLQGTGEEGIHGYGEYTPTLKRGDLDGDDIVDDPSIPAEAFYTVPDDPLMTGITPGSGGGDAFDIAWALDPETGDPAQLGGFDLIRLSNGVSALQGPLGEKSPEIDAVADVAPDPFGDYDLDGDIDLYDAAGLQLCFGTTPEADDPCAAVDRGEAGVDLTDVKSFVERMGGPK